MQQGKILREMIRTARKSRGKPLGVRRFAKETGITQSVWSDRANREGSKGAWLWFTMESLLFCFASLLPPREPNADVKCGHYVFLETDLTKVDSTRCLGQ
jgi:hypothetical protein